MGNLSYETGWQQLKDHFKAVGKGESGKMRVVWCWRVLCCRVQALFNASDHGGSRPYIFVLRKPTIFVVSLQ